MKLVVHLTPLAQVKEKQTIKQTNTNNNKAKKNGWEYVFFFFQVHSDKTSAQDQLKSQTVKLEKDKAGSASKTALARNYTNQLKVQVRT